MSCIFCKIANKEVKSSIVHESENVIAFDDAVPQAPVHVVVMPKEHVLGLSGLNGILPEIFGAVEKVSEVKGVRDTGYRVVMNIGKDPGQAVSHLHFHVLGGRKLNWPPG